jgi:hypothetical protein
MVNRMTGCNRILAGFVRMHPPANGGRKPDEPDAPSLEGVRHPVRHPGRTPRFLPEGIGGSNRWREANPKRHGVLAHVPSVQKFQG